MMVNEAAVVVGVDGSAAALRAVDWAATDAARRHRPLRIVHAFLWPLIHVPPVPMPVPLDPHPFREEAERILAEAVERARVAAPGVPVRTAMPECGVAAALIEHSRHAALVVVGSRGLGGFTGLLVGSVGVQTAAHAACPVVVVHEPAAAPGPFAGQVVVGVDASPGSDAALGFAFEQASFRRTGLAAVHAYRWPMASGPGDMLLTVFDAEDLVREEQRMLAEAVAGWQDKYPDVPVTRRTAHGRAGKVLADASAGAQLIVVGSRGRGGFSGLLLGSTSQTVLHHVSCPVAIVHP